MTRASTGDRTLPFFLRAYQVSHRVQARAADLPGILFQAGWLGFLSRERLARLDELFYGETQESQPEYTGDEHNLRGLYDWESEVISRYFPASGRVLLTGAGGGRELVWLLRHGYDAVGYEPHPKLVAAGRGLLQREGLPDQLHVSERDGFPAGVAACDAVIVGWCSYMLVPGRERRLRFLRGARAVLPPGAPLLLSFAVRDRGAMLFHEIARLANLLRRLRRDEPVEPGDMLVPNFVHHFTADEVAAELRESGFELEMFTDEPYGHAVARAA